MAKIFPSLFQWTRCWDDKWDTGQHLQVPPKEILMDQISTEMLEVFLTQNLVIWAVLETWMEGSLAPGEGSADGGKRPLSPPLGLLSFSHYFSCHSVTKSLFLNVSAKNYKTINPCLFSSPLSTSRLIRSTSTGSSNPKSPSFPWEFHDAEVYRTVLVGMCLSLKQKQRVLIRAT